MIQATFAKRRMKLTWSALGAAAAIALFPIAITPTTAAAQSAEQNAPPPFAASTLLMDQSGKEVGTVALRQTKAGPLWINASLYGLPMGTHAFHIHETGDCGNGFKAAGGHYAPRGKKHGVLSEDGPHAGDLPNIYVPESGRLNIQYFSDRVTLDPNAEATLFDSDGSAIVIHAGVDDYSSQPAGAAGERIACGVIENRIDERKEARGEVK